MLVDTTSKKLKYQNTNSSLFKCLTSFNANLTHFSPCHITVLPENVRKAKIF